MEASLWLNLRLLGGRRGLTSMCSVPLYSILLPTKKQRCRYLHLRQPGQRKDMLKWSVDRSKVSSQTGKEY